MYALILAGGFATRLWPLTKDFPKPLLPLGDKRIIEYPLEKMSEIELDRIFISTNSAFKYIFSKWLKTSEYVIPQKTELILEPSITEEQKLGAIRGIDYDLKEIFSRYEKGDILIMAGDNICDIDLRKLIDMFNKKRAPIVAVREIESIEEAKRYGVVMIDEDNRIIDFEEKPKQPKTRLIATAIYILPRDHVSLIRKYLEEGNNPDAPGYFFAWLTKKVDVYAYKFTGPWFDIGTPKGYFDAVKAMLSRTYIGSRSIVYGKIIEPCYIGNNVEIDKRSIVGPYTIICDGAKIRKSRIDTSLIMEGSIIEDANISQTLIGYMAMIKGGNIENSVLASHTRLYVSI